MQTELKKQESYTRSCFMLQALQQYDLDSRRVHVLEDLSANLRNADEAPVSTD
jgi:hypothetical protein